MAEILSDITGNWNVGATWELGTAPDGFDNTTIQTGDFVTVTNDTSTYCTDLTVNLGGTLDINGKMFSILGDYDQFGTIDTGGGSLETLGSVNESGSTVTELNLIMSGTGETVNWNNSGNEISELTFGPGASVTTSAVVYVDKVAGSGSLTLDHNMIIPNNTAGDWWSFTGSMSGSALVNVIGDTAQPGGDISVVVDWLFSSGSSRSITIDGNFSVVDLSIVNTSDTADVYTITMDTGKNLTCSGQLRLGTATGNDGSGALNCGTGTHEVGSITFGNAANTGNAIDFESSDFACFGLFDLDHMTVTASGTPSFLTTDSLTIGAAGDLDLNNATMTVVTDFAHSGQITTRASGLLSVGGSVTYPGAGTITVLTLEMTGTGETIGWDTQASDHIDHLIIASGAVIATSADIFVDAATIAGSLSGAHRLDVFAAPSGNWWGTQTGTMDCDFAVTNARLNNPGNDITVEPGNSVLLRDTSASAASARTAISLSTTRRSRTSTMTGW